MDLNSGGIGNVENSVPDGDPPTLVRRRSTRSSLGSFDPQSHAILYNPLKDKLKKINQGDIPKTAIKVDIPGRGSHCKIFLPPETTNNQQPDGGNENLGTFYGTVDLSRLGKRVSWKRWRGSIRAIYLDNHTLLDDIGEARNT